MVFEIEMSAKKSETKSFYLFIYGFIITLLSILLGYWVFPIHPGFVAISLIVLASSPLFYKIAQYEESKDISNEDEIGLIKEHLKAIKAFTFWFLGLSFGFFIFSAFSSKNFVNNVFSLQIQVVSRINPGLTGGFKEALISFITIAGNNLKVLLFCILFSFIFGIGSLFILTWNASVFGFATGALLRKEINEITNNKFVNYFGAFTFSLLRFSLHGIIEIIAYFIAGLAGSIISFSLVKHHFSSKKFDKILLDVSDLIIISVILILIAAFIEVFITPVVISFF